MPETRRWYDESDPSPLMREGFAQAHLLKLAEVVRQSYDKEIQQPPLGFLFKRSGVVTMVPDLFAVPKNMWQYYLSKFSLNEKADYYVIVCEGAIAPASKALAEKIAEYSIPVKDVEGAREGVLIVLNTSDNDMRQMLFLPHTEDGLGEVEVAAGASDEDYN